MRRQLSLAAMVGFVGALSGCDLYLGAHHGGEGRAYCDETGCYTCDDFGCYNTAGTDPDDRPDGMPPGASCSSNNQCAPGCYCQISAAGSGACAEAGFCNGNTDCAGGMVCDNRGSCV